MFSFFKKKKSEVKNLVEVKIVEKEDYEDVLFVAEYFKNETGIVFDKNVGILKDKLVTFCKMRGIPSFKKLIILIETDQKIKKDFIDKLTTNETYFYREFAQIKELLKLVKQKSYSVNILCAPSSTGEESYSIAIALLEAGVSSDKFNIVGIDINESAIEKAKIAIYKERNIRNLSLEILGKYFINSEDKYILKEYVKSLVTFKTANIFNKSFTALGKFDFIFSRNMFIYFDYETKLKAKDILENMRKDDSQDIFLGHADLFINRSN
ncbi:MAG: protein-glutamate O-methyltransferase CheR [Sulfurimonas sp.]|nr:protein-glutamate O-methyltransferase CheR [Sulfurimonas sp.]